MSALRIALIASARFPVREPFAGGLESHTWSLADGLRRRGHRVTLFAEAANDLGLPERPSSWPRLSEAARADVSMTSVSFMQEHHAYLAVMSELTRTAAGRFDVVHNNSLHYLPVAMASAVPVPTVTTLHTPPTPWLESAIQSAPCPVTFVAVSVHTARAWHHVIPCAQVIPNGTDLRAWSFGPGGPDAVWFGRLVPEKGTHLAVMAARRAGYPLRIAGPRSDPAYWTDVVEPMLGDGIRYIGHLSRRELAIAVGNSRVCLITPRWDEPYGLVAAEALACGTPVAGFARGAVPEVVDAKSSVLVGADDVDALAAALPAAAGLSRTDARIRAEQTCSVEQMLDRYEALYHRLADAAVA